MKRREFLGRSVAGAAMAAMTRGAPAAESSSLERKPVRIGVVGVGNRGTHLMKLVLDVEGVQINAVCDLNASNRQRAIDLVTQRQGRRPEAYGESRDGYDRMLQRDDVDAVLIATPTKWHCPMAIAAMKAGKHVASEVPAGFELEELWDLVRTKEQTGRRYILLENYLYGRECLAIYQMVQKGLFGDPYYAESAYIHDCRFMLFKDDGSLDWWGQWASQHYGHDYPTHGMGPLSKWLGINEGDRLTHCSAMMSTPRVLKPYAIGRFGPDSEQAKIEWVNGDYTSMMVSTARGRLIRSDYDVNSPRPVAIYYVLQGVEAAYDSREGIYFAATQDLWEEFDAYLNKHEHPLWREHGKAAAAAGHGGGDYFVVRAFVNMVREDREPWIDVYDAATWSVLFHCSRESIDRKGGSIEVPDFTGGRWRATDWRKGRPVV